MVSIDEELATAKHAQTVISRLPISLAPDPDIMAALRMTKDIAARAISIFPSEAPLNDARIKIVNTFFDLIRGPLMQGKIDQATSAIEVWIRCLERQPALAICG